MSDRVEEERKNLIEAIQRDDKFIQLEDGFHYFWPISNRGAFEAHHLRWIADELDRRNKAGQDSINNDPAIGVK